MQNAAAIANTHALGAAHGDPRLSVTSRLTSRITRFDLFMAAALTSLGLLEVMLCRATALALPPLGSIFPWTDCKIAAACAIFCFLYPNPLLCEATRLFFWSSLWGSPLLVLVQLAARSPFLSSIIDSPQSIRDREDDSYDEAAPRLREAAEARNQD